MAHVEQFTDLPADPDTVWREIGSFQGIGDWHPLLASVEGEGEHPGAVRSATGTDGSRQVERLCEVDAAKRSYSYVMESSAMPVKGYQAELQVRAGRDGTSTVRWTSDFQVTAGDRAETVEMVRGFFAAGLESLADRYASRSDGPGPIARDGFVAYDEFEGPDLDDARWQPARLPLPTGEHIPLDPEAEVTVGDGEVRVTIPRFSLSDDRFQAADSVKYLMMSTRRLELPPDRPARFVVGLSIENIGGDPGDYRKGIGAFQVADLEATRRVFSVCGTSTRVLALHEHLPLGGGGPGEPFVHMVESPYEDFEDDFTRLRECEITLDRGRSIATWRVDGHQVYSAHGALIPAGARMAFGIYTQLPIRAGRSQSLEGQGISALWRRPRTRGVETPRTRGVET